MFTLMQTFLDVKVNERRLQVGREGGHSVNKVLCLLLYRQSRGFMQHEQRVASENNQSEKEERMTKKTLQYQITERNDQNKVSGYKNVICTYCKYQTVLCWCANAVCSVWISVLQTQNSDI